MRVSMINTNLNREYRALNGKLVILYHIFALLVFTGKVYLPDSKVEVYPLLNMPSTVIINGKEESLILTPSEMQRISDKLK